MLKNIDVLRWVVPLGLNSVTNTEEYGGRTCLLVLCFLSLMSIFFIYITMAQTVQKDAGLGHAWQKMVCLFTDRRGIDAKPRSRWIPVARWNGDLVLQNTQFQNNWCPFAEHGKLVAESSDFHLTLHRAHFSQLKIRAQKKRYILSEKRDGAKKAWVYAWKP